MSQLLQSGVVSDLQSAYDKAIRLNDEIWQKQQEEARQAQAQAEAQQRQQTVTTAKAKAVSPRSSSPTGTMSNGNGKKSLRDTLAEQLEQQLGGRV
jgi:DNA-directed RNA polymerase specialized sigma54-like protein